MRDIQNIPSIELDNGERVQIVQVEGPLPKFDIEDYDLLDEKDFNKFIASVKMICRGSFEYRALTSYLRENVNMNKCSFYENVNNINTYKIKIHIHHEPFTLEDITRIVFSKRMFFGEDVSENMVAKEVMFLHYNLLVGLIPLAETVHELVHNNYLFVPLNKVMGRIEKFVELYEQFISPEMHDMYGRIKEYTEAYNEDVAKNLNLLDRKYIYFDMTGEYDIPSLQSIVDNMNTRIKQLRDTPMLETEVKEPSIRAMTRG